MEVVEKQITQATAGARPTAVEPELFPRLRALTTTCWNLSIRLSTLRRCVLTLCVAESLSRSLAESTL